MRAAKTAHSREIATDQDLALANAVGRIWHNGKYGAICADTGIPRTIHAAIVIQPSDERPSDAFDGQKCAAGKQTPRTVSHKSLCESENTTVSSRAHVEQAIKRAVVIQPGDMVVDNAVDVREEAADDNASVRLDEQ